MARDAETHDDLGQGVAASPREYAETLNSEDNEPANRWDDPVKFVPVFFVLGVIFFLYAVYVFWHCIPMLQLGEKEDVIDDAMRQRAFVGLVCVHVLTGLILITYTMCIFMSPGTVPDGDPRWDYDPPEDYDGLKPINLQERKKTGDRRHCKWCGKYKPDRCHHCRVCRICVLKMDHHCPWIYNCVGFNNYKVFFLLIVFALLDCHLIVWTMAYSVKDALTMTGVPFSEMFILLFGETVGFFFTVLLTCFVGFHIWLMCRAMTTIEFCEKALPKDEGDSKIYDTSLFDLGLWRNVTAVLGDNPLLWLIPCSPPGGTGYDFAKDPHVAAANAWAHQKQKGNESQDSADYYGAYGTSATLPAYGATPGDDLNSSTGAYGIYGSRDGAQNFNYGGAENLRYHSGGGGYGEDYR